MSEREYIVTLKKGVDYDAFNAEMIATTGSGDIPGRSVTVANARPASQRNTHYMLTDAEAAALNNDTRVVACELRPDLRDDIEMIKYATQTGNFSKSDETRGEFVNWGLRRINEADNPYIGYSITGGYNYTLDGTGVDVVIQDSGIQADHPDFQDYDGTTRIVEHDWFDGYSGGGTMPTAHYTDYDGHGTHVAGILAGKTYGWAKNAKIYAVKVAGLEGSSDPNSGIAISDVFDVIKEWHAAKPVDPVTGAKRPTVVNMSWGYTASFTNITGGNYRGVSWTGTTRDTAKGMIGSLRNGLYRYPTRVASVDTDVEELIDAGVHVCISAGNYKQKIDVDGGDDYDNYFTSSLYGTRYYHRGGSPHSQEAFIVGNIDTDIAADGKEQKAESSETGPGVNIYAPGTSIFSTLSDTTVYTSGPYPANADFNIGNLSGTSMASPQMAGVLALWLQLNPGSTPAQALNYFKDNAKSNRIYQTANNDTDYTNTRSILGSGNRYLFNKFNSATQLSIGSRFTESETEEVLIKTYLLSTSAANVNEGDTFTITLTTTNIENGTVVPYEITGVTSGDIGSPLTGSFTVTNNTATASFTVSSDGQVEGAETFTMTVVGVNASINVTINDSVAPATPTYGITPAALNIDEGSALTINVATTNVSDATTLYWTVTNSGDFGTSSGSFVVNSNAGSFTVTPTADTTTEGAETFTVSVRTGSVSGTVVATSSNITINDTSESAPASPTYTATPAANNIDEGSALTINVATTNVANSTTLYWTVSASSDFASSSGSFNINSDAGSFTVTPTADSLTEGSETFTVSIRTDSISGTVVDTTDAITINDTSTAQTYDATPAALNIDEGSALTVNVATTNVSDATTLYWTVTNSGDFGTASGSFTITSNAGSFTVTPTADTTTEGAETFTVSIRTGSAAGPVVDTTDSITINDTSQTPAFSPDYTITVTNSGNSYLLSGTDRNGAVSGTQPTLAFNAGDNVRFSVNSGTSSSHPFYIKTAQSTGTGNQVTGATGQGTTQVDWTTGTDGAGSYGYQCSIHLGMWNTITIS